MPPCPPLLLDVPDLPEYVLCLSASGNVRFGEIFSPIVQSCTTAQGLLKMP
jgi:hypothetical protein